MQTISRWQNGFRVAFSGSSFDLIALILKAVVINIFHIIAMRFIQCLYMLYKHITIVLTAKTLWQLDLICPII